jgi:hypothetical protein
VIRPDGLPVWTSAALPGRLHDLTCAQDLGVTAALNWAASELDLPTLADSGYEGAGLGIKPLPNSLPTVNPSRSPTAPSTSYYAACAGKANAASPCWSDAGKHCVTRPPAHAGPATSSPQPCTSPISNTNTYPDLVEITSLDALFSA